MADCDVGDHWCHWDEDSLILNIRAQPRASTDGFAEVLGDAIKLRITCAPVEGKANAAITAYLAKSFGVPRQRIRLLAGTHSRTKRYAIDKPTRLPHELNIVTPETPSCIAAQRRRR